MQWIKDKLSAIHQWFVDNVWKPSWTKFLSWTAGIPAALVAGAQFVSTMVNDTTVQGYMASLHVPTWFPSALTGIALVYYIASGRK